MFETIRFYPTRCAVCDTKDNATELYPASYDLQAFNPAVFSARRAPDRIHYRVVKCDNCGLVRSDPVADIDVLARLYARSAQTYDAEIPNLARTYGSYLAQLNAYGARKGSLLEIGCGSGFFLGEAVAQGFTDVHGVEPSQAAVAKATPRVRPIIVHDVMRPGLFAPEQMDVICMFQVLDHIPDPNILLDECFQVLKPGGLILCLNHDVGSFSARLLGERSPIVDIEHTYLYSRSTGERLFVRHGFQVKRVSAASNIYTLNYVFGLMPISGLPRRILLAFLKATRIGRVSLSVSLGNLCLIAQKPTTL
jgi:SAM-dependent methyltransferase